MNFDEFTTSKEEMMSLIDETLREGNLTEAQAGRLIRVKEYMEKLACVI